MEEEEHFVNIDLNDDNICSICKLETDRGTLSFCHVCFELSIEGTRRGTCCGYFYRMLCVPCWAVLLFGFPEAFWKHRGRGR